ncbi:hypothetical protein LOTGIDRAFT_162917 [Lottia gigantea]|uniref:Sushi domain-containing protein n=1 Tax=Lottia gigantea TaxID=225164 RepID=V4BT27_LOTGI|nr:hypothetical protein LOTGIDRAFT_162917 [Lottia gigantea]ESO92264.1 hypothetical protein LOTGIDRAFT_162917 [Lottia gigantea]
MEGKNAWAKDCGPPPHGISSGFNENNLDTTYPHFVSYSCMLGYERASGQTSIQCQESGQWESDILICKPKPCGNTPLDVIFVVDQSSSADPDNFSKMKNGIADFISSSFVVSPMEVNVGVVAFSSDQADIILRSSDPNQLLTDIRALMQRGGSANFALGISKAVDDFSRGSRSGTPKVMILLSGGKSIGSSQIAANAAKAKGINIFTIGIGPGVDKAELREIASDHSKARFVDTFDEIRDVLVVKDLCQ